MWKNRQFYEVSVEERLEMNHKLELAYLKRGQHIIVEKDCDPFNIFTPEPSIACMNFDKWEEEYSFHCGSFWYEETNIVPVIAMTHELGHYMDVSENFKHDHKEYHYTLGTKEIEVRAWLYAVDVCNEIGFTRWDVFYKYAKECLTSYFIDIWGWSEAVGYTGTPTLESGLLRLREKIGVDFEEDKNTTTIENPWSSLLERLEEHGLKTGHKLHEYFVEELSKRKGSVF